MCSGRRISLEDLESGTYSPEPDNFRTNPLPQPQHAPHNPRPVLSIFAYLNHEGVL